jgi:hypothetical protein
MARPGEGQVYFEITVLGGSARVSAIDAQTNTEVQVICPANYTRHTMQQAALRKLRYVLEKKAGLASR